MLKTFLLGIGLTAALAGSGAKAQTLDLSNFKMTFDEEFSKLDISAHGPGTRWTAHTPWHGDFGNDVFDDPGNNGTFQVTNNGLSIVAHKDAAGTWHSGLICSVDDDGPDQKGFSQQYGYFEIRTKFPDGPGVWPAFWLIGTDTAPGTPEIDVIEYYGRFTGAYHITEHYWVNQKDVLGKWNAVSVPDHVVTQQFNTFGVMITPATMTFYMNRAPVWSTPTPPAYRQPMYMLANLAIGGGWPYESLPSPQVMQISYIRAYQQR